MMTTRFIQIENGKAIQRKDIPHLSFNEFRKDAVDLVQGNGKVVQFFGYPDGEQMKMLAVLRKDNTLWLAGCDAPDEFHALTCDASPFHMFEREMAEQYGLRPQGHPWLKMVRYHKSYRDVEDVFGNDYSKDIPGNYPYYAVKGPEIHEVAVGPVHAGVIEPGHFRFNCIGERVLNLEIQLGYQHRDVERFVLNQDTKRLPLIAENVAGDTSVGNSLCLSQAIEALTGIEPDQGAKIIRTIGLELERIANHIGDLGALSGDVAFLPPANYCGRMRGDFLNLTLLLCGNRMGKGLVRPGGTRFDLPNKLRQTMNERLTELRIQVKHTLDLLFTTSSVLSRFDLCGAVSKADADELGLVGPAGRASGLAYDSRRVFPTEYYHRLDIPENAKNTGDVHARATVRAEEVLQSLSIIRSLLSGPVETKTIEAQTSYNLAPSSFVVTVNEAWRGELSHAVLTDGTGRIQRYKVKDPSFHNWNGLSMALRNTGISDFPLNNKSFNLSYCGFDL